MSVLNSYLKSKISSGVSVDAGMVAYLANLELVSRVDKSIAASIVNELEAQRTHLKMIASENYCSLSVQGALGNLLTDKYAEGFPHHRYYAGCENIDSIEAAACDEAKKLFGAEHAYVQPHSGADANMVAFWSILCWKIQEPFMEAKAVKDINKMADADWKELRQQLGNQRMLGLNIYSGGHLTHGYRPNVSARMFEAYTYDVDAKTQLLDYAAIRKQALEVKPLILLAGYSAYPRPINFRIMKEIADEVGAVLMVDMAHFAGLVAGKVFTGEFDPVPYADIVTSTTHKTLRGPRGGLVLCKEPLVKWVDQGCPLVLGGPLAHCMAAKAIAFKEANTPAFQDYAQRVVKNSQALAAAFTEAGCKVTSGGTDNHLMVLDVNTFGLTGRQAETAVRKAGITLNRNTLPFDPNGAWYTSGLRLGTPALTTLGMGPAEMKEIAGILISVLKATEAETIATGPNAGKKSQANASTKQDVIDAAQLKVQAILARFPLYPELDLSALRELTK